MDIETLRCSKDEIDLAHEAIQRLLGFLSAPLPPRPLEQTQLEQLLKNPLFRIVIVRDTRKAYPESVVGMASIIYQHKLGATVAEIHDVVVDPACRGEGLGERLVHALIVDATRYTQKLGHNITLSLTSKPSRVAANALYVKLGFALVATAHGESGTNLYRMIIRVEV